MRSSTYPDKDNWPSSPMLPELKLEAVNTEVEGEGAALARRKGNASKSLSSSPFRISQNEDFRN